MISALEINLLLSLLTSIYSNTYHYSRESDIYNIYIVKNSSYYNGENYSMLYNTQAFDKELQDLTEYCQLIQALRFTKQSSSKGNTIVLDLFDSNEAPVPFLRVNLSLTFLSCLSWNSFNIIVFIDGTRLKQHAILFWQIKNTSVPCNILFNLLTSASEEQATSSHQNVYS